MNLSQVAWNLFKQHPGAKRFHVATVIEKDTAHATLSVSIDDGLLVDTIRLGFPVVNAFQRREMLASQRWLQRYLEQLGIERRQRIIAAVTVSATICQAKIAAMQAHNAANAASGSPPDYPGSTFFLEANQLQYDLESLRQLI